MKFRLASRRGVQGLLRSSWTGAAVIAAALLGSFGSAPARADGGAGVLEGRVLDGRGAPVAGATITARNLATGLRRSAVSDAEGGYRLDALPAGAYDVMAEASGFGTGMRESVAIAASGAAGVDFVLEPAARRAVAPPAAGPPTKRAPTAGPRLQIYGFAA